MRLSTLLAVAALGAAGYCAAQLSARRPMRHQAVNRRLEPIVMWFETVDERNAFCEGAD